MGPVAMLTGTTDLTHPVPSEFAAADATGIAKPLSTLLTAGLAGTAPSPSKVSDKAATRSLQTLSFRRLVCFSIVCYQR